MLLRDVALTLRGVFVRPSRLRRLAALGPAGWGHTLRFVTIIIPRASRQLRAIRSRAAQIPDLRLRAAALESIDAKAYHVQGGSILATFLHGSASRRYVELIAPLETIYDYLDDLCDRFAGVPSAAYPTLHEALVDALDPSAPERDYYRDGPAVDDGGYLRSLVADVQRVIATLPHYPAVASRAAEAARFYRDLQSLKHLPADSREAHCAAWYEANRARFPDLRWWEFAAACGSSLPVFAMLFLASRDEVDAGAVASTYDAYFPNVSAVHILLDYFIDQAEDREHRELNFVACYRDTSEAVERVRGLVAIAAARLGALASADRHVFVLQAMCTFYLTHPKVFAQRLDAESAALLGALG